MSDVPAARTGLVALALVFVPSGQTGTSARAPASKEFREPQVRELQISTPLRHLQ